MSSNLNTRELDLEELNIDDLDVRELELRLELAVCTEGTTEPSCYIDYGW